MISANSSKYISLKAAAELYGYTRDHLGLMIRKSRLKGVKLGSYYVTTNEWMADYVRNYADLKHPVSKGKLSNKFLSGIAQKERVVAKPIERKQSPEQFRGPVSDNFYTILPVRLMAVKEREAILKESESE